MQNERSIFGRRGGNSLVLLFALASFSNPVLQCIYIRFPLCFCPRTGKSRLYPTFSISSSDAEESPLHRSSGGGGKNSNTNSLYNVPYQSPSRNTNTVHSLGSASYQIQQQQQHQQHRSLLHHHQQQQQQPLQQQQHNHQSHAKKHPQQQQAKHINLGVSSTYKQQQHIGLGDTPSSSDTNGCGSEATLTDTEFAGATTTVAQGKHYVRVIILYALVVCVVILYLYFHNTNVE